MSGCVRQKLVRKGDSASPMGLGYEKALSSVAFLAVTEI